MQTVSRKRRALPRAWAWGLVAAGGTIGLATPAPAGAALVTQYKFDGDGTDAVGGRNLTLTNASFSSDTPGGVGQSVVFNGTSTRAIYDVAAGDSVSGNFTVTAWVNTAVFGYSAANQEKSFFGTRGPTDTSFDMKLRASSSTTTSAGTAIGADVARAAPGSTAASASTGSRSRPTRGTTWR